MRVTDANLRASSPRYSGKKHEKQKVIIAGIVNNAKMIDEFSINTPLRMSHFIAQIVHEAAGLRTTREFASGAAYEGRRDLGNTVKGDGRRFRGRGLIQVTGRANYTAFNKWAKATYPNAPSFMQKPSELEKFPWALLSALWYWSTRNLNKYADLDDVKRVTKIINGGYNGLDDREKYLAKAKHEFRVGNIAEINVPVIPSIPSIEVREIQTLLCHAVYNVRIDGIMGKETRLAIKAFQRTHGLDIDGIVGVKTIFKLRKAAAPKPTPPKEPIITTKPTQTAPQSNLPIKHIIAAIVLAGAAASAWLAGTWEQFSN